MFVNYFYKNYVSRVIYYKFSDNEKTDFSLLNYVFHIYIFSFEVLWCLHTFLLYDFELF